LGKGIRDGVVQVVDRRSLLDVGVDRGNWLRISADEFGELFAGLVGAKGMIARKLRFRQKNGGRRMDFRLVKEWGKRWRWLFCHSSVILLPPFSCL